MIRVAFYAPLLDVGGTQRHLQQVLRLLDPKQFQVVEVVTLRGGGVVEAALLSAGVKVRSLDMGSRLVSPQGVRTVRAEARWLRAARIEVLQAYQWRPSLLAALAGRMAGVPVVMAGKRSLTGANRQAQMAWRFIGRWTDTIVTNADALQAEAELHGVRGRWAVLRNGVDVDHFDPSHETASCKLRWGFDPSRPVVGSIGRLEERKGHALLLEARAVLSGGPRAPQILLVGDGPCREALSRQASALGLGADVRLVGEVSDVREALGAMDVFVLPSHEEGMSNALLEAMAAARPIVVTDVGGNREVVGDGCATIVPSRDPQAMATAIGDLLRDPVGAGHLGNAARAHVDARFGARRLIQGLQSLYAERLALRGQLAA